MEADEIIIESARWRKEYLPAERIRQHAMLFEAMAMDLDRLEELIAREIKTLRDSGVFMVSKPNKGIVGPLDGH